MVKQTDMSKTTKWVLGVFGVCFLSFIIAWATWVTDGVYCAEKEKAVSREVVTAVKNKMDEIDKKLEKLDKKVEEQKDEAQKDNKEILKILIDIKSNQKTK